MTPDGRFLVFPCGEHLTPDDVAAAPQLFEYDSQTNTMTRVSIGQDGFNDNGNTTRFSNNSSRFDLNFKPFNKNFAVSSDGSRFYFENEAGLTPQAPDYRQVGFAGEVRYAENVYEYHDGSVCLISDGQDLSTGLGRKYQCTAAWRRVEWPGCLFHHDRQARRAGCGYAARYLRCAARWRVSRAGCAG